MLTQVTEGRVLALAGWQISSANRFGFVSKFL